MPQFVGELKICILYKYLITLLIVYLWYLIKEIYLLKYLVSSYFLNLGTFLLYFWYPKLKKKSVLTSFSNFQSFHNLGWITWRPGIKGIRARHGSKPHHNSHGTYWWGRFWWFRRRFRRFRSWILIRNRKGNLSRGIENCSDAPWSVIQVC